jgi:hypothetical protein
MSRIRGGIAGLALVCAAAAIGAIPASATLPEHPEYSLCVKQTAGKFNKGCASENKGGKGEKGGFEVKPAAGTTFKLSGTTTVRVFLLPGESEALVCERATKGSGEITGPASVRLTVDWEGCGTSSVGRPCTSVSAAKFEQMVIEANGTLKPLAERRIGIELKGSKPGNVFTEFRCETEPFTLSGAVEGVLDSTVPRKKTSINFEGGRGAGEPFMGGGSELLLSEFLTMKMKAAVFVR